MTDRNGSAETGSQNEGTPRFAESNNSGRSQDTNVNSGQTGQVSNTNQPMGSQNERTQRFAESNNEIGGQDTNVDLGQTGQATDINQPRGGGTESSHSEPVTRRAKKRLQNKKYLERLRQRKRECASLPYLYITGWRNGYIQNHYLRVIREYCYRVASPVRQEDFKWYTMLSFTTRDELFWLRRGLLYQPFVYEMFPSYHRLRVQIGRRLHFPQPGRPAAGGVDGTTKESGPRCPTAGGADGTAEESQPGCPPRAVGIDGTTEESRPSCPPTAGGADGKTDESREGVNVAENPETVEHVNNT